MKNLRRSLICFTLLAPLALQSQQSTTTYEFRTLIQPGTGISGHVFTPQTHLDNIALNDAGEFAFIADWPDQSGSPMERPGEEVYLFASRHIVALPGLTTDDGKYIISVIRQSPLFINPSGQIAYAAWYCDSMEEGQTAIKLGIFIDRRLALEVSQNAAATLPSFTLTDDGQIVLRNAPRESYLPAVPPAQRNPRIFGGIRIPRPKGFPQILTRPVAPQLREPAKPAGAAQAWFAANHRGQILLPVNLSGGGFLLLLGSPAIH